MIKIYLKNGSSHSFEIKNDIEKLKKEYLEEEYIKFILDNGEIIIKTNSIDLIWFGNVNTRIYEKSSR